MGPSGWCECIAEINRLNEEVALHVTHTQEKSGRKLVLNGAVRSSNRPFPNKEEALHVIDEYIRGLAFLSEREREYFDEACNEFSKALSFIADLHRPKAVQH